jgi:hypothetical protein
MSDGELQAAEKLAQAAKLIASEPAALQLRLYQTLVEVASEPNMTIVMPVPIELLNGSASQQAAGQLASSVANALAASKGQKGQLTAGEKQADLEQLKRELETTPKR